MAKKIIKSSEQIDESRIIVGLDIGTFKVSVLVGLLPAVTGDAIEVIAVGSSPSKGMQRGVVTNIDYTVQAIEKAVLEAEAVIKRTIKSVYVSLSGSHIASENSSGMVTLKGREVTEVDISNVIEAAKAINLPADRRLLHILPQSYALDKHHGIKDPLGMSGMRLEVNVHLVSCKENAIQNIQKCVKMCGLAVDGLVSAPLAASYSVLTEDEKELGVCMLDIGAGTTDIIVTAQSQVCYTAVLPVAGDQVTNDIALTLRTPIKHAEDIKTKYSCALASWVDEQEQIQVPNVGGRPPSSFPRYLLAQVSQARYAELFRIIEKDLKQNKVHDKIMGGGIVLTGGGSKMEGLVDLATSIFSMPVRLGIPSGVNTNSMEHVIANNIYSVATGLLIYNSQQLPQGYKASRRLFSFNSVCNWFRENF
jgi:cell division protein FtsA